MDIIKELSLDESSDVSISRKINAAFLMLLINKDALLTKKAQDVFNKYRIDEYWSNVIRFYETSLKKIEKEISDNIFSDSEYGVKLKELSDEISHNMHQKFSNKLVNKIYELFFPEGFGLENIEDRKNAVDRLRNKRKIKISGLNPQPITEPVDQILFTSNILATVPLDEWDYNKLELSVDIRRKLDTIINEKQKYWYDHPIPLGISPEKNEVIYGLRGLNEMVDFEKSNGRIPRNSKLTCLLSASTTHNGLHEIIKDYFAYELKKNDQFNNLEIYIFTEIDTDIITEEILIPLINKFQPDCSKDILFKIFGVDGEYGRHYSFLKAVAAFWQVFINPDIKATFKIDLDQVFPQQVLVNETGNSALDHFKTSLWGAKGIDSSGNEVELSMIAGALVNQNDIDRSLFTPDVKFSDKIFSNPESVFFNSKIPQALSTEAEMMMRYKNEKVDEVIQRIHVTGGTNGILIDALRKHRPFTPSLIGRAEDQSYLLSVLFKHRPALRYLHKPGLIMRHDKHAFAAETIAAAATGKIIGDYIRILIFSAYARALPWDINQVKSEINPFTGSFVSPIPMTIVSLRFAFKVLELSEKSDDDFLLEFQKTGSERLLEWFNKLNDNNNLFSELYKKELEGWNVYYDLLDIAEKKLKQGDEYVLKLKSKAIKLVENCLIIN
jgi:hypothetical protein